MKGRLCKVKLFTSRSVITRLGYIWTFLRFLGILRTPWRHSQGNSSISTSILHQPQRYTDLALWRVINFCKVSLSVFSLWFKAFQKRSFCIYSCQNQVGVCPHSLKLRRPCFCNRYGAKLHPGFDESIWFFLCLGAIRWKIQLHFQFTFGWEGLQSLAVIFLILTKNCLNSWEN